MTCRVFHLLQSLSDRLNDSQMKLTTVKLLSEQLSAVGHHRSVKDTVAGLQLHHGELVMLVRQLQERLQQAVRLRRQYTAFKTDLDSCLKQCKEQTDGAATSGVTMDTKLHRLEVRAP